MREGGLVSYGAFLKPIGEQEEIQRRRDLVRTLFNDFWSGAHNKPAAFVVRLDQAEDLSERAFGGETAQASGA